jgi:predicted Ser/Thr protein kinase/tetratricopeptide (TPR) repeat protein
MSRIRIFGLPPEQVGRVLSAGGEPQLAQVVPAGSPADPTIAMSCSLEQPGHSIGRYKLLQVLGEGGMGVVYLAEQTEPVRRQVALKIIKPGMDSKRVVARFEAEQQALAMMEHPHIARVYDAGLAPSGRPYFVMEYVKGIPITEHCDKYRLTIEERLRLFLHVCEAVQHAHQKGIIHRDLKPSNILVIVQDKEVIPKVIDFGVARAISQPLIERTLFTEQGQLIGTPEYMSPEQANLSNQDIDTRTDAYSLGVVLYQLLAGVLPFDAKTFRIGGIEHIRKVICEEDAKTPSTRLSQTSVEEFRESARRRRTDIRTLQRKLRGDLDWITLKAVEKDRTRRYPTVDALATDIRLSLSHQPVVAAPPGTLYRARKFAWRHRQTLAALGLTGLVLVGGLLIAFMSLRAARERTYAQSLEDRNTLAEAQTLAGNSRYGEALARIGPLLRSPHVGRQAKLLHAQVLLEQRDVVPALAELEALLDQRDETAGQAHFLLANVYHEDDPWSPGKTEEYRAKWQYHRQEAERLIAGTAQYFFLEAKASPHVPIRLEYLRQALEIDNGHFDSLRERASICHAQQDYSRMDEDASQMIGLRPGDPAGYLLRALARREQGRWDEALADHHETIRLVPSDPTLYFHRSETYGRVDRLDLALADALRAAELDPNNLHYHGFVFALRVACGRYEQAKQQYQDFLSSPEVDLKYRAFMPAVGDDWSTKDWFDFVTGGSTFVFLARQPSWKSPPEELRCSPVWAMREATEDYHKLSRHARCIVEEGFSPTWSPDGTKIAYSQGTHWASAIAILDIRTGTTQILTAPGRDPRWSPDGRTIAFVRDRQSVAMDDISLTGHIPATERRRTRGQLPSSEEVCVIDVISGDLRRAPEGTWPTWGVKLISPDGRYMAESDFRLLRVRDLRTGEQVSEWIAPPFPATGLSLAWSPDNRQLSIGGCPTSRMGLWVFDIQTGEARRMLGGSIMSGIWSPDLSRMLIVLSAPHIEVWSAKLDPNRPTVEALGDGATVEDHCRELIEYYSRGVATDPNHIESHLRRTDAALWIGDPRAPRFLNELEYAFQNTPYQAEGCAARAQAILSGPAELRDRLRPLALLLARKAASKEPENPDYRNLLEQSLPVQR